ncbi:MAG: hypothetical protein Q9226_007076 [Calogaya cf. arnoldii]
MGAWGYGLLQSDAELDVVDEIEVEVARLAKKKKCRIMHPKQPARVASFLNDGLFHRAFQYFQERKWNHGMIYLVVLAMRLGCVIPTEDLADVAQTIKDTPMYKEAKGQLELGLATYKNNGEPMDFGSKGMIETANASASASKGKLPGGPNDMAKALEKMTKDQEESKAKKAKDPKPEPEPESKPKPSFDSPQDKEWQDRMEKVVKAWFDFQTAPE